jgi:hypothetical protein
MPRPKIILVSISFITTSLLLFSNGCDSPLGHVQILSSNSTVLLKKYSDSSFSLISSLKRLDKSGIISEWKLNYPVFHFERGDIDGDGTEDILVGVIKPTRYDSVVRKRIFIFKLVDGYIRPMWLGSRVSQPLEDFKVIHTPTLNYIRTIEQESNGLFLVADYKWKGFGLRFMKYEARALHLMEAQKLLNQTIQANENA